MFLYLLFFLLSLGQLGRISFFNQEVNVNLIDIYLLGTLVWWTLRYRLKPIQKSLKNLKVLYVFIIWFFLTLGISLARYSTHENLVALHYLLRLSCYFLFFIYLSFQRIKDKGFNRAFILFGVVTIAYSLVQFFLYPNLRNLLYLGWDPHQNRVFGTFLDTSAAAAVFGLTLLYFVFQKQKDIWVKYVMSSSFAILGLLTYARSFFISIILSVGLYLFSKRKYLVLFAVLVVLTTSLFLLPKRFGEGTNLLRTFSIESRLRDEREGLTLASKNLLFGIGYNHIRYAKDQESLKGQEQSHAGASFHSSYLIVLTTSGIVGLALFLLTLIKLGSISEAAKYYTIFLAVFSLFDNILLYPLVTILFFTLLAREVQENKKVIFRT